MIVYGIKNCDTVKKALQWLGDKKISFEFHDYKSRGISTDKLMTWSRQVGWETLVNKKGMTWRQLTDSQKEKVINETAAIEILTEKTSLIKRPLIEKDGKVTSVGFDEKEFTRIYP
jgi:Spx/MgsR family transcriptional regulator